VFTFRSIVSASLLVAVPAIIGAQQGRVNQYGNPEKLAPRPTAAAITQADLMTRLYVFADDSMEGRNAPLESNARGNAYIVRELTRMGITPAGEIGSYLQRLPYVQRTISPLTRLRVGSTTLAMGVDFTVQSRTITRIIDSTRVIYAGVASNPDQMIPESWANNRFVIVSMPAAAATPGPGGRGAPAAAAGAAAGGGRGAGGAGGRGAGGGGQPAAPINVAARYPGATAIATIVSALPAGGGGAGGGRGAGGGGGRGGGPGLMLNDPAAPRGPAMFQITEQAAQRILGRAPQELGAGTLGGYASGVIVFDDVQVPHAANVLAVIPGSDPALRHEVVVISAHNDHVGIRGQGPVDHDSLRAARLLSTRMQIQGNELVPLDSSQQASIRVNLDSLRRMRPVRRDSINNGADDDGSGSMAVLEIAEAINAMPVKPKRTILFAWWTAEEDGLVGSGWFSNHSPVNLNSVVANINMDMIGRGRAEDIPGGGPDYLGYLGANRLASILNERVQAVNQQQRPPLKLDNRFDWPLTWSGYNNIYGRSDHANFSRYNIPIVFFFTGLHADYHQVTDEPQYIDYPHYTRIVSFVRDLTVDVANLPTRPVVDLSGAVPPRPPR
jgi:hypothetical protein